MNEKADPRRRRRAMTEDELHRLLETARVRPVLDVQKNTGGRRKKGEPAGTKRAHTCKKLKPETVAKLDRIGRERVLISKTLVLTGLRRGELSSLIVGQMHLDGTTCYAELEAADEKNGEGSSVPVRDDLAADLCHWLAERLAELQDEARAEGRPVPLRLPPDLPLFAVPEKLSKILNRDLKAAGIPKRDDRGRVLDVHALRTTFGTLLSNGGVSPRTAQAAMRHSKLELTMSVYTDPKLLDVRGALGVLPTLPLDRPNSGTQAGALTGTGPGAVAPTVALESISLGCSGRWFCRSGCA